MPSYTDLNLEAVWRAQYVPAVLNDALIVPLRNFYGMGPNAIGAPGDNNHLYGRHRSYNWDKYSIYCTDREYGTTDARDQGGNHDWYRAVDTGITGATLQVASRRMDALVRSGGAPGVAEWFGTFDGVNVVGWYEGHASSSDDSHLYHLHVGFWNQYANDPATMQLLYATITGSTPLPKEDAMAQMLVSFKDAPDPKQVWLCDGMFRRPVAASELAPGHIGNDGVHQAPMLGNLGNGGAVFASIWSARDSWGQDVATLAGSDGGSGPTHDEMVQAAFEGSQQAEKE